MVGDVIDISGYRQTWREALCIERDGSTLQVYVNDAEGLVEIVQMNLDGEAIRTQLSAGSANLLADTLRVSLARAR